jgi:hypothetical protein
MNNVITISLLASLFDPRCSPFGLLALALVEPE